MRIGIVGGGPAGLYFALLMKQHDPNHEITVVEQNLADATYGWGVVFAEKALAYIEETTALTSFLTRYRSSSTRTRMVPLWVTVTASTRPPAPLLWSAMPTRGNGPDWKGCLTRRAIWYEAFHDKMHLDPLQLAYSYMTRSGRVDGQTLREMAPSFMARYEAYVAAKARETPEIS
jgi:hypothetical protein